MFCSNSNICLMLHVHVCTGTLLCIDDYYGYITLLIDFGQVFSNIGVYETQQSASVAFSNFGTAHR